VEAVRDFNRFYTRQLGLLERGLLGSEYSLTESRVLYELARADKPTAAEIARELRMDFGYLSRLLAKFERRGLLTRKRSQLDARRSSLTLTRKGRAAFIPLDRAAGDQVESMIGSLAPVDRRELLAAMHCVRRLLEPRAEASGRPITLRALRIGDVGLITRRQALLYAEEYGWDETYEALVAEILAGFVRNFDPEWECGWIAERDGEIAGSVFLVRASAHVAKLRLLYVEPWARGAGLGRRLVRECIERARAKGYRTLTLWTNDVLVGARHLYEAAGFRLVGEEKHRSFGRDLVGQTWELAL